MQSVRIFEICLSCPSLELKLSLEEETSLHWSISTGAKLGESRRQILKQLLLANPFSGLG